MMVSEKIEKIIKTEKCLQDHNDNLNIDTIKTVEYGKYMQQNNSKSKPLDWILISKNDNSIVLLSKYILDCGKFNESQVHVELRDSTLYRWLWNDFMDQAFSADEQEFIEEIACLSLKYIKDCFNIDKPLGNKCPVLKAYYTEYSKKKEKDGNIFSEFGAYWLADSAEDKLCAFFVDEEGYISKNGGYVDFKFGIRPLIILKLK